MKKTIYIILTAFLGLILSFIAHAVMEMIYLAWARNNNVTVSWTVVIGEACCALPLWLIYLLPILGIIFGIVLGLLWWQKIYVQSRQ